MDYNKLKKRPSFPIETIAVAVAFSPRFQALLSEAGRMSNYLGASLILIHVGEKTADKQDQLEKGMSASGINANNCRIIWMDGDPVETILNVCKLNIVDLLILGALQKESVVKFYLGSVARSISRKAKTSVLLLTEPKVESRKVKKIIVNGVDNPKTIHTINTSLYLASKIGANELTIVTEVHNPALAMTIAENSSAPEANKIKKDINEEQESRLQPIIEKGSSQYPEIKIKEKIVNGRPGYAISNYARTKNANLLVINSPDANLRLVDRIFTHDMEYVLQDLPCNVLIVHSRL
ncbi:MAG: universal stress protein [Bacteroidia bacterium]|nr:universal stress protein [Bacteroidia bacterium]